jgi:serine/threonine protein kinase
MLVGYPPFWSSSDEHLLLSILGGKYTMPSPYWDNIKSTTKDLIRSLIVQPPQARLTAAQALDHPAVSDRALGRKVSLEKERKRDFLAVISGIRAMIKFKRANVKSVSRRLSERGDLKSPIPTSHSHIPQYNELESVFE